MTYTNPSPGEARLTFGKHKGMTLAEIVEAGECSYVQWLARTARTSPAPELRTFGRIAARYLKTLRKGGAVNGNQEER